MTRQIVIASPQDGIVDMGSGGIRDSWWPLWRRRLLTDQTYFLRA